MSLTLDQARNAVIAVVQAVTALAGVPVYDYMRHVTDENEIKTLLVAAGRLHFWWVVPARDNPVSVRRIMGPCDEANPYMLDVHGFYALKDADASEKAFLTIVGNSVFEALRLTRHVTGDIGSGPPQWIENDHRMLSSVLVHHVRIGFPVRAQFP